MHKFFFFQEIHGKDFNGNSIETSHSDGDEAPHFTQPERMEEYYNKHIGNMVKIRCTSEGKKIINKLIPIDMFEFDLKIFLNWHRKPNPNHYMDERFKKYNKKHWKCSVSKMGHYFRKFDTE